MTTRRKPLRLIVARTPETWEKAPGYFLTHYVDTLSCGHQVTTYSFESAKKRRGCGDCAAAQVIPESSLVSFPLPEKKAA